MNFDWIFLLAKFLITVTCIILLPFNTQLGLSYVKSNRICGSYSLRIDEACLRWMRSGDQLWLQSSECSGCDLQPATENENNDSYFYTNVDVRWPTLISLKAEHNGTKSIICNQFSYHFGEFGIYELQASNLSTNTCSINIIEYPVNAFLPILWIILTLIVLKITWIILIKMINLRCCRQAIMNMLMRRIQITGMDIMAAVSASRPTYTELQRLLPVQSDIDMSTREAKIKDRIRSLDTFRGLIIVTMIFVNYGGGKYWFFQHSPWNGLTVADLVFPCFLWIMGLSIVLSTQKKLRSSVPRRTLLFCIFRRSCFLFILGLMVNSRSSGVPNDIKTIRIPGVLQRFAISYALVAFLEVYSLPRDFLPLNYWSGKFRDFLLCRRQILIAVFLCSVHACISLYVPQGFGCPTGYVGPGGLHLSGHYSNCTGGSAGMIDRLFLGPSHMLPHSSASFIYKSPVRFDPEGILGCLSSIVVVLIGVQVGTSLLIFSDWHVLGRRWFASAVVLATLSSALCSLSKNDGIIPINKNLWSVSYSLAASSISIVLFTVVYLVIDVFKLWSGNPLSYVGMNAIFLYVGHEMAHNVFPFFWNNFTNTHFEFIFMNVFATSIWVYVSYWLYKKSIFITL